MNVRNTLKYKGSNNKASYKVNKQLIASGVDPHFWRLYIVPAVRHLKGDKCETCGDTEDLDVHHTRYDVQDINTLMLLCRSCHRAWHEKNGNTSELFRQYGVIHPENINKHSQSINYTNSEASK